MLWEMIYQGGLMRCRVPSEEQLCEQPRFLVLHLRATSHPPDSGELSYTFTKGLERKVVLRNSFG
jgi:hypothetical protein